MHGTFEICPRTARGGNQVSLSLGLALDRETKEKPTPPLLTLPFPLKAFLQRSLRHAAHDTTFASNSSAVQQFHGQSALCVSSMPILLLCCLVPVHVPNRTQCLLTEREEQSLVDLMHARAASSPAVCMSREQQRRAI